MTFSNMKYYLSQGWNYVHLFGSSVLALIIYTKVLPNFLAFIIAMLLGVIWEAMDELLGERIDFPFDPFGWDTRDLAMDGVGIVLAIWIVG